MGYPLKNRDIMRNVAPHFKSKLSPFASPIVTLIKYPSKT